LGLGERKPCVIFLNLSSCGVAHRHVDVSSLAKLRGTNQAAGIVCWLMLAADDATAAVLQYGLL
jgi:hypothetical protein